MITIDGFGQSIFEHLIVLGLQSKGKFIIKPHSQGGNLDRPTFDRGQIRISFSETP